LIFKVLDSSLFPNMAITTSLGDGALRAVSEFLNDAIGQLRKERKLCLTSATAIRTAAISHEQFLRAMPRFIDFDGPLYFDRPEWTLRKINTSRFLHAASSRSMTRA
jgi:hypothetical protein